MNLEHGPFKRGGLYSRVGAIILLMLVVVGVGFWLGQRSVKIDDVVVEKPAAPAKPAETVEKAAPVPPPMFFQVSLPSGAAQKAVIEEIAMASAAGLHQYILDIPLPWQGDLKPSLEPINILLNADSAATMFLYIRLDPPASWLAAHSDDEIRINGKGTGYASIASEAWREDAHTALEALVTAVATTIAPQKIQGYVLGALKNGCWHTDGGYDTSPANLSGFRKWLTTHYRDNTEFADSWGKASASFDTAQIPKKPDAAKGCESFLEFPAMRPVADFLEYTSETCAEAIAAFAKSVTAGGKNLKVIAPYGYSFELTSNDAGHFALARLLNSDVDGFISPISYFNRGLGGVGGVMGPVDSVVLHGKQWYLVDDTRTGIMRDPASGEIARPKNVRAEDIYHVQERNFATALTDGLGLVWTDAEGQAACHDAEMWRRFGKMMDIYRETNSRVAESGPTFPVSPVIAVVVDEPSRFVQQCESNLNQMLLNELRDAVVRVGVPVKFYLLDDMLADNAPSAPVYLFLNAFSLTDAKRDRLLAMLQRNKAAGLWMYAPGYFNKTASIENITATVKMAVKAFDGPVQTGSQFLLGGRWVKKDETFGITQEIGPLFYIDDPQTNVIAQYAASGKPSLAVSFFEEGWASIYCADPTLTTGMLRELLSILEIHNYYQPSAKIYEDAVYFGPNLMAIHANETGERAIDLGRVCSVQDLFAPEIGWQRRRSFNLPLKTGDTRLFRLSPVEEK